MWHDTIKIIFCVQDKAEPKKLAKFVDILNFDKIGFIKNELRTW